MAPRNSMLAAAGLAAGGYVASQAFVPSASGPMVNNEAVQNLRGASATQATPSEGLGSALPLMGLAGSELLLLDVDVLHDVRNLQPQPLQQQLLPRQLQQLKE